MLDLFHVLLFVHVLGAIIAFGPGFAAPVAGRMVAREPQHANFYGRVQALTARAIVTPVAIIIGITGVLMILERGYDFGTPGVRWLEISILLYVVALGFAIIVQGRAGGRLVALSSSPPGPEGPSAELRATARRVRLGGMFLGGLVAVIVFLMVTKPF
jgi:uncharacterized membrane protein